MSSVKLALPQIIQDLLDGKERAWVDSFAVNEFAQAHGALRAILYQFRGRRAHAVQVMGQAKINADSPYLYDVKTAVEGARRVLPDAVAQAFRVETDDACRQGLLLMGPQQSALVLLRAQPWNETDVQTALQHARILWAHRATLRARLDGVRPKLMRWLRGGVALGVIAASVLIQIPIRVVAPTRVVPRDAIQVTAPVSGRVAQLFATPNGGVAFEDPIFKFEDTFAQGQYRQTVEAELVAAQRLAQLQKTSFVSAEARQQLTVLEAELKLATVEREAAELELSRYVVTAPRSGVLDIPPIRDIQGSYYERGHVLGRVFDPNSVELQVDVDVLDAIVLTEMSGAVLFLNDRAVDALALGEAEVPLKAELDDRGTVSYAVTFDWPEDIDPARVGTEGVVRLHGPLRPVIYVILRRPIDRILRWLWS